jgi:hypothetical protein
VAALDGDHANAAHDVGMGDAQDAPPPPPSRAALRHGLDGLARGLRVDLQIAGEPRVAVEPGEHEVGVRDGRPCAALAVAGRSRHGFGAGWADTQRAPVVDPGDRAAARTDGVDVDDGKADGDLADPGIARRLGPAVANEADVGAGAADVHGDDGVGPDQVREVRAGDDARRPDSTCARALPARSPVISPPEASITMMGLSRPTPRPPSASRSRADNEPRYLVMIGVRKALSTVVLARSNSRNSRRMSVEMQMTAPGSSRSSTTLASRSCAGLA